jgi:hypothetical protein
VALPHACETTLPCKAMAPPYRDTGPKRFHVKIKNNGNGNGNYKFKSDCDFKNTFHFKNNARFKRRQIQLPN